MIAPLIFFIFADVIASNPFPLQSNLSNCDFCKDVVGELEFSLKNDMQSIEKVT